MGHSLYIVDLSYKKLLKDWDRLDLFQFNEMILIRIRSYEYNKIKTLKRESFIVVVLSDFAFLCREYRIYTTTKNVKHFN
jgi:hypothetical protein